MNVCNCHTSTHAVLQLFQEAGPCQCPLLMPTDHTWPAIISADGGIQQRQLEEDHLHVACDALMLNGRLTAIRAGKMVHISVVSANQHQRPGLSATATHGTEIAGT